MDWLKRHSKVLNFFGGIFLLLLTIALYLWTTSKTTAVSSGGKSAQERRMDRSVNGTGMGSKTAKKSSDMSILSRKIKNSKQAENFLLFMMVLGFGMVTYSIYTKYKEEKKA